MQKTKQETEKKVKTSINSLTEEQAFKIVQCWINYFGNIEEISEEDKADFVMQELINLKL